MGCATSRLRSKVDVRDLEGSVRTGDLILFSSKHASAQVTKCFTASEWDHIGLVVKFSSKHVYILEYAGGVYLYPLFTRLYTYYAIQGRNISLRRLLPGQDREAMQQKVETFVRTVLGHSPPSIQEMVVAVLKQETYISSFVSKMAGGGGEKDNALTNNEQMRKLEEETEWYRKESLRLDGLLEELITQKPPVITGAPARLEVCGGCKGQPIRKGLLGAQDEVTVTTWGRAPCGEWWCSDCLALRVHDAAPAYEFVDIVRGDLVLAVQIDCNGKMHMIKDFFFTTFVGAKRVPAKHW